MKHGRLIDADALIEAYDRAHEGEPGKARQLILDAPTIEERTGKWQITEAYPHNVYCSECHKRFAQTHWAVWEDGSLPRNFCPNCGADMRGEEE